MAYTRRTLLGLVAALAAVVALTAAAAPGDDETIYYEDNYELQDAVEVHLQGKAVETSTLNASSEAPRQVCVFDWPELSLEPDEFVVEARQVWFKPATCETSVEIGFLASAAAPCPVLELLDCLRDEVERLTRPIGSVALSEPAADPGSELGVQLGSGSAAAAGATGGSHDHAVEGAAYLAFHEDPPDIVVSSTRSNISWSRDGSCVLEGGGSAEWTWYTKTNWILDSHHVKWAHRSCSSWVVSSWGNFHNTDFPCPYTAYTWYHNVSVRGRADGSASGWIGAWGKDNDCNMLQFKTRFMRTA